MIEHYLRAYTTRFVSCYLVLTADMGTAAFSFMLAWFVLGQGSPHFSGAFVYGLILALISRFLTFLLLRSYQGIIRHTSPEDLTRLLYSVSAGTLIILITSQLIRLTGQWDWQLPWALWCIDYCFCLVGLSLIRLAAKTLYWKLIDAIPAATTQPVLIYGAGQLGLLARQAVAFDNQYRILAFVDDDLYKTHKFVQGLPVLSRQQTYQQFIHKKATLPQLILAIEEQDRGQQAAITDFFLNNQVTVKIVPPLNQWLGESSNKVPIRDIQLEDLLERPPIQLANPALTEQLSDQVILVTGAAGSIGSELVSQLITHCPHTLIMVDQAESALFELEFKLRQQQGPQLGRTHLVVRVGDVTNQLRMSQLFTEYTPNYVFHAAAYKHVPLMEDHPHEAVRVNVMGTQIVADLALRHGVKTFVMISTDKAINPTNVMGATKRLAEMYVQSLNQPDPARRQTCFIATRFGNVLGSQGSVVRVFQQQIKAGGPLTVTHPDIMRYFMTIPEACQLVLEAGIMGQGGEVFVFDMGSPVRIAELARKLIILSGRVPDEDIAITYTGLRPGEKLYEELLHNSEVLLPTHHAKIMIAQVICPEADQMQAALLEFDQLLKEGKAHRLVALLKWLIPEYISNNSVFNTLDSPSALIPVFHRLHSA